MEVSSRGPVPSIENSCAPAGMVVVVPTDIAGTACQLMPPLWLTHRRATFAGASGGSTRMTRSLRSKT